MKVIRKLVNGVGVIVLALVLVACALHLTNSGDSARTPRAPDALRIATFNVHYIILSKATGAWSVGDWDRRKAPMDAAFKAIDADIVAFQEMESFSRGDDGGTNLTLDYLLAQNPEYAAAAVGDWRDFPSTQPILYRRDAFKLRDQGWFFFSDTPDVIYSRTFNGSYPAFASWAAFEDRSGRLFHVFNVHFEFKSLSNRQKSAELVSSRMRPVIETGAPVFLVGDVNAMEGSGVVGILEAAGLVFSPVDGATYHLNRGINLFGAIDHIAYSGGIAPRGVPVVLRERFQGEWPSDHYPVFADFGLTSR